MVAPQVSVQVIVIIAGLSWKGGHGKLPIEEDYIWHLNNGTDVWDLRPRNHMGEGLVANCFGHVY